MFGKKKAEVPVKPLPASQPAPTPMQVEDVPEMEETPRKEGVIGSNLPESTNDELTEEQVRVVLEKLVSDVQAIKHHLRLDFF